MAGGNGLCIFCNGMLFDSENTRLCGDSLLWMREYFGIKIIGKDIFYKVGEKRWVKCSWPYKAPKTK